MHLAVKGNRESKNEETGVERHGGDSLDWKNKTKDDECMKGKKRERKQ